MWLATRMRRREAGFRACWQAGLEARQNESKGIILNEIEELLFTVEIVVETREGDSRSTADVANGSAFKALFREDAGGMTEDMVEFGFGVARIGNRNSHRSECRTIVRYFKTVG